MKKNILGLVVLGLFLVSFLSGGVSAVEDEEDIFFFDLELDKVLALVNGWIALFLFVVAFLAYKRDGRERLFYVSLAFFLFAIKSFLVASELVFPEAGWIDPVAKILEFGVLLSFFYGVLKK